jgi:hypothetical protein
MFKVLKHIKQDRTFSQGAFKDSIQHYSILYSVDLTNATDRFPIRVIADVLKGLLPSNYVDS